MSPAPPIEHYWSGEPGSPRQDLGRQSPGAHLSRQRGLLMVKFKRVVDRALSIVAATALLVMMMHVVLHALARFLLNAPISGTNEMVQFWYLPVVALLGIPAAQLQREHITVTLLVDWVSRVPAIAFRLFSAALCLLVSIGFAWFGFDEALQNTRVRSTAGFTDVITWPVYYLVPLVFAVLAILYLI